MLSQRDGWPLAKSEGCVATASQRDVQKECLVLRSVGLCELDIGLPCSQSKLAPQSHILRIIPTPASQTPAFTSSDTQIDKKIIWS